MSVNGAQVAAISYDRIQLATSPRVSKELSTFGRLEYRGEGPGWLLARNGGPTVEADHSKVRRLARSRRVRGGAWAAWVARLIGRQPAVHDSDLEICPECESVPTRGG